MGSDENEWGLALMGSTQVGEVGGEVTRNAVRQVRLCSSVARLMLEHHGLVPSSQGLAVVTAPLLLTCECGLLVHPPGSPRVFGLMVGRLPRSVVVVANPPLLAELQGGLFLEVGYCSVVAGHV